MTEDEQALVWVNELVAVGAVDQISDPCDDDHSLVRITPKGVYFEKYLHYLTEPK